MPRPRALTPCLEACTCCERPSSLQQSLDEMDFARSAGAAAASGSSARLAALLSANPARASAPGPGGYTPMHYAARGGHVEAVRMLLAAGAAVDPKTAAGGATPLHRAATAGSAEVVALLLAAGASAAAVDGDGQTPLHKAAAAGAGRAVLAALLAADPAAVGVQDVRGRTPADVAVGDEAVAVLGGAVERGR